MYKNICSRAVNKFKILKEVSNDCYGMAMYYDPSVGYKNNLIFNFMNFNENLNNGEKKVKKLNG